jgi:ATPase subunit of ABC transporter with duplicated ATPase domains
MSLLSVENLGFAYGARGIFAGLDFSIEEGDRVGLIGPNGCGKSTLLRVLAGREEIDEGRRQTRRNLVIAAVEQMLPPELESRTALEAVAEGMAPGEREIFAYRAEAILSAFGFDEAQAATPAQRAQRRLAAPGADRARGGGRARPAAAGRADQSSRPRQDPPPRGLDGRRARLPLHPHQPRPHAARPHHRAHADPARRQDSGFRRTLQPGA